MFIPKFIQAKENDFENWKNGISTDVKPGTFIKLVHIYIFKLTINKLVNESLRYKGNLAWATLATRIWLLSTILTVDL